MKLFLDASVLLAACGRPAGGSRAVCDLAAAQGWRLLAGDYVMREVSGTCRDASRPRRKPSGSVSGPCWKWWRMS